MIVSSIFYWLSFQDLFESKKIWENQGLGNEGMSRVDALFHYYTFISIALSLLIQVIICFFSFRIKSKILAINTISVIYYIIATWSAANVVDRITIN